MKVLKNLRKNKRADVTDMIIFLLSLFVIGMGLFILVFTIDSISDGLRNANINNTIEGNNAVDQLENFGTIQLQRGFMLFFVGLIISTMISSFLVRVHPIFLFLYIAFLILTVFLGTYLANAYDTMRNIPLFADELASQTLINVVFENMVTILIAVGALSLFIVFAKFSSIFGGSQRGQL
jgi:hypothetical protein